MTFKEWKKRYASESIPMFVLVDKPIVEVNVAADMCAPQNNTPLGQRVRSEMPEAQFDGVKIEDMIDSGFAAARFAKNQFQRIDASMTYQQEFVGKYNRAMAAARKGGRK